MTTKKRWLLLLGALVVVAAPQVYLLPTLASSRPDVERSNLLLKDPAVAMNSPSTDWRLLRMDMHGGEIARTWMGPRGSALFMAVMRYSNPVSADYYYWAIDPTNDMGEATPSAGAYRSVSADRSKTVCEDVHSDCERWEYWARYGQYLVRAGFDALADAGARMDLRQFDRYARYVDRYVSAQLN